MKIFLASSGELANERDQIEILISRKSNTLKNNGHKTSLETIRWENLPLNFSKKRKQEDFNNVLSECEVLIVIFYKKVGQFTNEELAVAYKNFKENKNPIYIYIFFFEPAVSLGELNDEYISIIEMKEFIKKEEQIFIPVKSKSELLLRISYELDFLLSQKDLLKMDIGQIEEMQNIKNELDLLKSECCDKIEKGEVRIKLGGKKTGLSAEEEAKIKELEKLDMLLFQINAQRNAILNKIEKDEILFGHTNPSDIAERARIEFEIEKTNKEIEKLKK